MENVKDTPENFCSPIQNYRFDDFLLLWYLVWQLPHKFFKICTNANYSQKYVS
jgi:hypothetical protein